MRDATAALIVAVVIVPLAIFLIYLAFRNLTARVRDVRDAVNTARSTTPNPSVQPPASRASDNPAAQMAVRLQAQAKKSDEAHKARIRAHVHRKLPPPISDAIKAY